MNFAPSNERPANEDDVVPCPLVEMFMLAVCKRFAQDLVRRACADIYFVESCTHVESNANSRRRSVTSSERTTSLGDLKFPASLNVKDIYRTIMRHDRYDFLTNKYMGVYVDDPERSGGGGDERDQAALGSSNRSVQSNASHHRIVGSSKLKKNFSDSSLVNN